MSAIRKAPAFASDDWMLEQQLRAEMEAEAWRRLRLARTPEPAMATASISPAPAPGPTADAIIERGGSIILKALVRFALAAFGAYLAWIAGMDSGMGEFEVWLATGAAFLVTLSLSLLEPVRRFVHVMAETTRWFMIVGAGFGVIWLMLNAQSLT